MFHGIHHVVMVEYGLEALRAEGGAPGSGDVEEELERVEA